MSCNLDNYLPNMIPKKKKRKYQEQESMVDLELTNQPFMLCNWGKYLHNMIPKKKKRKYQEQ